MSDEKLNDQEIIVTKDTCVKYGTKDITLRPLSAGQLIRVTQLVTGTLDKGTKKFADEMLKKGKKPEEIQMDWIDLIGSLNEEDLLSLITVIIYNAANFDVSKDNFSKAKAFVKKNYTTISALRMIRVWMSEENITELFLEFKGIIEMIMPEMVNEEPLKDDQ